MCFPSDRRGWQSPAPRTSIRFTMPTVYTCGCPAVCHVTWLRLWDKAQCARLAANRTHPTLLQEFFLHKAWEFHLILRKKWVCVIFSFNKKCFWVVSILFAGQQCGVLKESRVDCGYAGISREECEGKGCCYSEDWGYKWCFFGKVYFSPIQITVHCIHNQKTSLEDKRKEESTISMVLFPIIYTGQLCSVEKESRQDCGYPGISQADCEAKGCCYSEDPGFNYCFFGKYFSFVPRYT